MALTVETGAVVTGADTYVSRADFIAFALTTGIVIADEQATDDMLVKAFRYINNLESQLKGIRTAKANPNAYPRSGLIIEDYSWLETEIPRQVILAQELLALDINAGIDIYNRPQSASTPIRKQRVEGAVSREFAVADAMKLSSLTETRAVLASLMKNGGMSLVISRG